MALICARRGVRLRARRSTSTTGSTFTGQHARAVPRDRGAARSPSTSRTPSGNFALLPRLRTGALRALQRFRLRMEVTLGCGRRRCVAARCSSPAGGRSARARPRRRRASRAAAAAARARCSVALPRCACRIADGGFGLSPGRARPRRSARAWVGHRACRRRSEPAAISRRRTHAGRLDALASRRSCQGAGDLERTILALAAARAPLGTLVARLAGDQRRDGSVGEQANLTAFAILALRGGRRRRRGRAAAWLARAAERDGGFSFGVRGDPSDIDDTAAAIEALVAAVGARAPSWHARVRYLLGARERATAASRCQPGGTSNAQSTAWAAQALIAGGAAAPRALALPARAHRAIRRRPVRRRQRRRRRCG